MTEDLNEAKRRVELMLEIVSAEDREKLSSNAAELLQGLPKI